MQTYIYPQNLKSGAKLWLWNICNLLILCLGLILSVVIFTQFRTFLSFAITAAYAFLTIRMEEITVMDYLFCAVKFFVTAQQIYHWR